LRTNWSFAQVCQQNEAIDVTDVIANDNGTASLDLSPIADNRHLNIKDRSQQERKATRQAADNHPPVSQSQHADSQMREDDEAEKHCPQGNKSQLI